MTTKIAAINGEVDAVITSTPLRMSTPCATSSVSLPNKPESSAVSPSTRSMSVPGELEAKNSRSSVKRCLVTSARTEFVAS